MRSHPGGLVVAGRRSDPPGSNSGLQAVQQAQEYVWRGEGGRGEKGETVRGKEEEREVSDSTM